MYELGMHSVLWASYLARSQVVLTLGYLAVQVKQNSQGMKVAAKLDVEKDYNEVHIHAACQNSELLVSCS